MITIYLVYITQAVSGKLPYKMFLYNEFYFDELKFTSVILKKVLCAYI